MAYFNVNGVRTYIEASVSLERCMSSTQTPYQVEDKGLVKSYLRNDQVSTIL